MAKLALLQSIRLRLALFTLGFLLLALLAERNGNLLKMDWLQAATPAMQFAWLVAGAALVTLGLGGLPVRVPGDRQSVWMRVALVAVLALAFVVRAWNLEEAVFMYMDEHGSVYTLVGQRISNASLLVPSWNVTGWSQVYAYLQSFTVQIFGSNLTGLRAVSVVFGTLTVLALYALATALFDRRTALLAALWLATFPPHIQFSRFGVPNIADPLFGVLALYCLVRGWREGRMWFYALAGAALGLTQYFYEGGRLLFPLLLAVLAALLLWRIPPFDHDFKRARGGLLRLLLAALIIAAPAHYALITNDISPVMRFSEMNVAESYGGLLVTNPMLWFISRVLPPFLHYVSLPDASNIYYGGSFGLVLPYLLPLFFAGLLYAARYIRQPTCALLLIWLSGAALGNGLIEQNVFTSRYVVVFPALALVIALGSVRIPSLWEGRPRATRLNRLWYSLVVLLAASQIVYYFGFHLPLYNQQGRRYHDFGETIARARDFPPDTQIHVVAVSFTFSHWQYDVLQSYYGMGLKYDVIEPWDLDENYLAGLDRSLPHAFFVIPEDAESIVFIRSTFPTSTPPRFSPYNVPINRQYALIFLEPE
ncbi:MAG: glycosyltransferase family 39 protein [Anaerolineae bacterium]|nr:glycosyltransferase family 39 protein [Anaerolineae bacterium]